VSVCCVWSWAGCCVWVMSLCVWVLVLVDVARAMKVLVTICCCGCVVLKCLGCGPIADLSIWMLALISCSSSLVPSLAENGGLQVTAKGN
jgi:hypothetical protein